MISLEIARVREDALLNAYALVSLRVSTSLDAAVVRLADRNTATFSRDLFGQSLLHIATLKKHVRRHRRDVRARARVRTC